MALAADRACRTRAFNMPALTRMLLSRLRVRGGRQDRRGRVAAPRLRDDAHLQPGVVIGATIGIICRWRS